MTAFTYAAQLSTGARRAAGLVAALALGLAVAPVHADTGAPMSCSQWQNICVKNANAVAAQATAISAAGVPTTAPQSMTSTSACNDAYSAAEQTGSFKLPSRTTISVVCTP